MVSRLRTKTARRPAAMSRHARPRWLRSHRAGEGSSESNWRTPFGLINSRSAPDLIASSLRRTRMVVGSTSPEGERNRCPGRQFTGKATRLQKLPGGFSLPGGLIERYGAKAADIAEGAADANPTWGTRSEPPLRIPTGHQAIAVVLDGAPASCRASSQSICSMAPISGRQTEAGHERER